VPKKRSSKGKAAAPKRKPVGKVVPKTKVKTPKVRANASIRKTPKRKTPKSSTEVKVPRGYQKREASIAFTKPKSKRATLKEKFANLLAEVRTLRAENKQKIAEAKALRDKVKEKKAKYEREKIQIKRIKKFLVYAREKSHHREIIRLRKEIIAKAEEIHDYNGDLEDYEREELFEDLREEYDLDFEDWLDVCFAEGYTEHDAYELWYYP